MKRLALILIVAALAAPTLPADSKAESLQPLGPEKTVAAASSATGDPRAALEKEYRKQLEVRLAEERAKHEASLENLWRSNAVVWLVLLGFVVAQALGARKLKLELARLRALRENPSDS